MGSCTSTPIEHKPEDIAEVIHTGKIINQLYVIGVNGSELGLPTKKATQSLMSFNEYNENLEIETVFSTNYCAIYGNHEYQTYYVGGSTADKIPHLKSINYFKRYSIKITKLCTNVASSSIYWISSKGTVYTAPQIFNNIQPYAIEALQNVMDIQSTKTDHYALCGNKIYAAIILNTWSTKLPVEIVNLIINYYPADSVYKHIPNNTTPPKSKLNRKRKKSEDNESIKTETWIQMETFKDIFIISISCGAKHSIFLDSTGNVYSMGDNDYGQRGIGRYLDVINECTLIEYFVTIDVTIKEIKCGGYYCLALDDEHNVYSWGIDSDGQCGHLSSSHRHFQNYAIPTLLWSLRDELVTNIECGWSHSYAKTSDNKHFLWGSNQSNECVTYDWTDKHKIVGLPHCINEILDEITNGQVIKSVHLGCNNTKIIMIDPSSVDCIHKIIA